MCGIIGYIGDKQASPILLDGLKRLEYRGYDSSGIGVIECDSGKVVLRKTKGKIKDLQDLIKSHPFPKNSIGISHTRWATHGVPNKTNAHPHSDCTGRIYIVHNGIIENYEQLKHKLIKKGHKFVSATDTEVIAHLIEEYYSNDLMAAVQKTIAQLTGAFALGVMSVDQPDQIIAARTGSPLIIGLGKNENFIASDVPAIIEHTRNVIYLKDGHIAKITQKDVQIYTFSGRKIKPKVDRVTFKVDAVKKQGYAHFMLKEMHEQPEVLAQIIKTRIKGQQVVLEGLGLTVAQLKAVKKITIIACGTAYHAGLVGRYLIEALSGIPVEVEAASEYRYRDPIVTKSTLVIAISQSGETADTLAAVREAKDKGAKVIAVCNSVGSTLVRESHGVLYTFAGPEIGVASTKAYTAQIGILILLAIKLGALTRKVSPKERTLIIYLIRLIEY